MRFVYQLCCYCVSLAQMIGVWAMCLWEQMGKPAKVNLIELGPGRGTLLADLLRVCFIASVYHVLKFHCVVLTS
jgi:SAM-dependent MidA family methyltransferase